MSNISRNEIIERIEKAKRRIRFLGVLAIDLDWKLFREDWLRRIDAGELSIEILREAEHFVSNSSIIASNKKLSKALRSYQFGSLKRILDAPLQLRKYLSDNNCKNLEPIEDSKDEKYKQCFSLHTCYLQIPVSIINIDDDYYIHVSLTKFVEVETFEFIDNNYFLKKEFIDYIETYLENPEGAKLYSTEETEKGNRLEVINAYNFNREVMFPFPRDSFPDAKFAKLVE